MNADMLNRGTGDPAPIPPLSLSLSFSLSQTLQYKLPHFQQRNMRKLANIARLVFGNSVQVSYFERFHWSILNFWTLRPRSMMLLLGIIISLCFLINRRLLQKLKSNEIN
jgi:hypothetical protein